MIGVSGFVSQVKTIASRNLTYKTGGTGKNGVCDCIGLIMGAMYELGYKKYDLHSTNYFARFQTLEMVRVKNEKELFVGQLLFRSRSSTAKLNARYQPSGSHYTGDMLDYYHVAVVTSVKPLEIIECTEYGSVTGIVVNKKFKNWQHGARLKGVLYDGYEEEEAMIESQQAVLYHAVVSTNQTPLSVRKTPGTGEVVGSVPKGRIVEVISDEVAGWPLIRSQDLIGYASADYLMQIGEKAETQVAAAQEAVSGNACGTPLVTIVDSAGNKFNPVGDFKVYFGGID